MFKVFIMQRVALTFQQNQSCANEVQYTSSFTLFSPPVFLQQPKDGIIGAVTKPSYGSSSTQERFYRHKLFIKSHFMLVKLSVCS